jgi:hypothetical protein
MAKKTTTRVPDTKLSKSVQDIHLMLEDLHEARISGVFAEDICNRVDQALVHLEIVGEELQAVGL